MGLLWYLLKALERLPLVSVCGPWGVEGGQESERGLRRSCVLHFYHEVRVGVIAFARQIE